MGGLNAYAPRLRGEAVGSSLRWQHASHNTRAATTGQVAIDSIQLCIGEVKQANWNLQSDCRKPVSNGSQQSVECKLLETTS